MKAYLSACRLSVFIFHSVLCRRSSDSLFKQPAKISVIIHKIYYFRDEWIANYLN